MNGLYTFEELMFTFVVGLIIGLVIGILI